MAGSGCRLPHPAGPRARDEPCWTHPPVVRETIVMTRVLVVAVVLFAGCQKKDNESSDSTDRPGQRAPNAPPQSAEELKTPLAKIDDVTITLGEFQERIN